MPKFYFHLHNDIEAQDETGTGLPDLAEAKAMAVKAARELMAESLKGGGTIVLSHWIEVENEQGQQVLAVRFGDCIEITP